eukprot:TRINITY_DN24455_c0_g1_i1.p1 TRINITY_DN24455_c0_g1~~TRINITY_DN24455_c0_g1_i1.p1  ORF type:complete len:641 (-),score=117.18 TRINITY_DN24455_c0_g1_i1:193-2070(-)
MSEDDSMDEKENKSGVVQRIRRTLGPNLGLEILSGVTVALALVPEAVAFALSAGLTPAIGLNSAWIISIFTATLGGRPAMICGATGSLAVLVGGILQEKGRPYLFYAVILMGIIEIALGLLGVGALVRLIPSSVMIGFCNGLACVIGLAQLNNFKVLDNKPVSARRLTAFAPFTDGKPWISGEVAVFAGIITALGFLICILLPKLTTRVPSALVAIVVCTGFEWGVVHAAYNTSTTLVGDVAALDGSFITLAWSAYDMPPLNFETFEAVLPLAVTMAAVGLLESLMTLNLMDDLTKTKGNTLRECVGQGVANIVCGSFGGMGGCAMIGQSMINITAGARSRVSSITAGLGLLLIVLVAYPAINWIPVSALVGVMFNVVYHTFEWSSLKLMCVAAMPRSLREKSLKSEKEKRGHKIRRADAVVILLVTLVTMFTDLATAVAVGMVLSCFMYVYDSSELISVHTRTAEGSEGETIKYYDVHGVLFFGSVSKFLEFFDEEKDPDDVRIVFESGHIADQSAIVAINKLGERYGELNKKVTLQQMKAGSSRLVSDARGLLKKELVLQAEDEQLLPPERLQMNVERGFSRQSSLVSRQSSLGSSHAGDRLSTILLWLPEPEEENESSENSA